MQESFKKIIPPTAAHEPIVSQRSIGLCDDLGGPIATNAVMFAKPRPKKSILPPPSKKRKTTSAVEEINFDDDARQEYLTGFHKRKQQRIKHAQEEAVKRARQDKLETRKQVRVNFF